MKLQATEIKKIAIFRALQLGDMLCAIPAIRALSQAYPYAEIVLIGLPWAKTLTERFPKYIHRFIHFPGYPGLPEQPFNASTFPPFLENIQSEQFDLVIQMQGNGSIINPLMELFGARHTAGFYTKHHYYPDNNLFLQYPEGIHETMRHLKLMQHLGIANLNADMEFPIYTKDIEEFDKMELPINPQQYVCVHAGSRGSWRQWPAHHFAKLSDYCKENHLEVVLTGTLDEMDKVKEVANKMHYDAIIAAGKTSIGAVGVLIKNARLLISNCTGVSHIAAALKTPSIVISMDGEPERWAPMNTQIHRTIDWRKTPDFNLALTELKHLLHTQPQRYQLRNNIGIS